VTGTLYLGTSGFAYQEWKGTFYPADLKDPDMLGFYASRFPSVEVNYTFRRYPAEKTLRTWAERTPEGFRFTLKANQRITHTRRLRDADSDVSDFLDRARLLGPRLGPILFQCPPTLEFDRGLLESFLAYLPPTHRYAFEFRHPSWSAARELLPAQGAAWCFAETEETREAPVLAEPFAFLRLRKEAYTEEELAAWAQRIGGALEAGLDVYAYIKHEEEGAAPKFADRLGQLVGSAAAMTWNTGQ
jgi:uncharacterized protein YecE (DUF72 family)